VPENDESRAFARIVSQLRRDDPRFDDPRLAAGAPRTGRRRGRVMLLIGLALCATAVLLITLGGPKGAVIALPPWLAGMILVIRSRAGN
jgi:ferric-dicitrate binding protein FerR (iron transport regulator)